MHSSSSVHLKHALAMESYKMLIQGSSQPLIHHLTSVGSDCDINCQRLDAIIDCVILHGILFCDHDDADSSQALHK